MVRLHTTKQTDSLTESAYGELLQRQEQLRDETLAIIERNSHRRKFWQQVENAAITLILLAMLSMGAWLGPVSKWVLQLLGVES